LSNSSNAPSAEDIARITELLGRVPQGKFEVVVRALDGDPVVLRNQPLLPDGTPMPTLYWLCGARENVLIGRLEATGAVNQVEAELDAALIAASHDRYAAERDALIPADHTGPRPFGGVAGTRIGVKCLHAHFGWWLAGGDDPVGDWVAEKLSLSRSAYIRATAQPVAAIDIAPTPPTCLLPMRKGMTSCAKCT